MSIDWDFIKQRPQFIAQNLAEYYQVTVVERIGLRQLFNFNRYKRKKLAGNLYLKAAFLPTIESLQKYDRWGILDFLTGIIAWLLLNPNSYDYVYIGNCISYKPLRFILQKKTRLIYDCMDDEKEFPDAADNPAKYNPEVEKKLVERADILFCTSGYLKEKLAARTRIDPNKISIIRNAISLPTQEYSGPLPEKLRVIEQFDHTILYIGAIAPWFDFDSILFCLNENPQVHAVLVGPVHHQDVPTHPRLYLPGPCEHRFIYTLMKQADMLTMPFLVNELIRSVNPVKLYEYIYSGKPVIASRYGETERFEEFVSLYNSKEEYSNLIADLIRSNYKNKQDIAICQKYVEANTWQKRVLQIHEILEQHE